MEKITFKYLNGRFIIKESYNSLLEADPPPDDERKKFITSAKSWLAGKGVDFPEEELMKIAEPFMTEPAATTPTDASSAADDTDTPSAENSKTVNYMELSKIIGPIFKKIAPEFKKDTSGFVTSFKQYIEDLKTKADTSPAVATESKRKMIKEGAGTSAATNIVNNFLNDNYPRFANQEVASILANFIIKNYGGELVQKMASGIKAVPLIGQENSLRNRLQSARSDREAQRGGTISPEDMDRIYKAGSERGPSDKPPEQELNINITENLFLFVKPQEMNPQVYRELSQLVLGEFTIYDENYTVNITDKADISKILKIVDLPPEAQEDFADYPVVEFSQENIPPEILQKYRSSIDRVLKSYRKLYKDELQRLKKQSAGQSNKPAPHETTTSPEVNPTTNQAYKGLTPEQGEELVEYLKGGLAENKKYKLKIRVRK